MPLEFYWLARKQEQPKWEFFCFLVNDDLISIFYDVYTCVNVRIQERYLAVFNAS